MRKNDETQDQFAGTRLPGTGGDFISETDVEGHRAKTKDAEPDGLRSPRFPSADGDETDVEGHRAKTRDAEPEALFRGGPTTQGEITRRAPTDNPHGER